MNSTANVMQASESPTAPPPKFQVGGPLYPDAFYIERDADSLLLDALRPPETPVGNVPLPGKYCLLLGTRQSGKSSLCIRTKQRIGARARCGIIQDGLGGRIELEPKKWFKTLAYETARSLHLRSTAHKRVETAEEWLSFLEHTVLTEIADSPVVLFYDELDHLIPYEGAADVSPEQSEVCKTIANEFFQALYTARSRRNAADPENPFNRLTVCLISGTIPWHLVDTPGSLFSRREDDTLFAIDAMIRLQDFSIEQIYGFASGLEPCSEEPLHLLQEVFNQTHGQPYLTQKVCQMLLTNYSKNKIRAGEEGKAALQAADNQFALISDDSHLVYTEKQLFPSPDIPRARILRALYRRLLNSEKPGGAHIAWQPDDREQNDLWLSGIAADRPDEEGNRWLRPRNPIVKRLFDAKILKTEN